MTPLSERNFFESVISVFFFQSAQHGMFGIWNDSFIQKKLKVC